MQKRAKRTRHRQGDIETQPWCTTQFLLSLGRTTRVGHLKCESSLGSPLFLFRFFALDERNVFLVDASAVFPVSFYAGIAVRHLRRNWETRT